MKHDSRREMLFLSKILQQISVQKSLNIQLKSMLEYLSPIVWEIGCANFGEG